jgi:hypothetical protein
VPSAFLEIVQLDSGEIVLRNSDGEGEPLVNIRFSAAAKDYIGKSEVDIAKVMIQAGIQAAAHINEARATGSDSPRDSDEQTLH